MFLYLFWVLFKHKTGTIGINGARADIRNLAINLSAKFEIAKVIGGDIMADSNQIEKSNSSDQKDVDTCSLDDSSSRCCYVIDPCGCYTLSACGCYVDPCCCC